MADKKISALTASSTPLAGTEVLPIVQSGATVKVSVANLTAGRAVATAGGSFTDNITQSTAAKGINFTANTPVAGMTSQLLNWYEEGTWTPTDISGGGLTLTVTAAYYTKVGSIVTLTGRVTYPANASAAQTRISTPFATKGPTAFTVSSNYPASVFGYANVNSMFFFLDGQAAITNASAASAEFNVSFTYIAA